MWTRATNPRTLERTGRWPLEVRARSLAWAARPLPSQASAELLRTEAGALLAACAVERGGRVRRDACAFSGASAAELAGAWLLEHADPQVAAELLARAGLADPRRVP